MREHAEERAADDGDDEEGDDDGALYVAACAAFCRGRLGLASVTDEDAVGAGRAAGLRLHRFKRARVLPRVQKIISTLRALAPASALDAGTGRGVMLWPLLEAFPLLDITCVDIRQDRVDDLNAAARGGLTRLRALCGAIEAVVGSAALPPASVDVAIASEVLEHVPDEKAAARALVEVARRFVVVTVPSLPDDNPEHIRLFTADSLRSTFLDAGAAKVAVDGVRGHLFAVVTVAARERS